MSKAQKFAQKRNTAGGTLKGVIINLEKNILPVTTKAEREDIETARLMLKKIEKNWSINYEQAKKENL